MAPDQDAHKLLNEDFLALDDSYAEAMDSLILPYLAERRTAVTVKGADSRSLACVTFQAEKPWGTVLIVHGFTENAFKFSEIIFSLLHNGFSVIAYDQRGHGNSWRKPGLADTSITHVEHFDEYVDDLQAVCDQVLSRFPEPRAVFCHSMGGAVTALYLEQHPGVFSRAVFCAPMIAPNRGGIPQPLAMALCAAARLIGHGNRHLFSSQPYHGPEDFATSCTNDPARFAWYDAVKAAHPEYQNSCPTYTWVKESLTVTKRILSDGAPERIACPALLFTAELDGSVLPEPQKAFIDRIPKGRHQLVAGAKHEIYRCSDAVLFPWWKTVLAFLKEEG